MILISIPILYWYIYCINIYVCVQMSMIIILYIYMIIYVRANVCKCHLGSLFNETSDLWIGGLFGCPTLQKGVYQTRGAIIVESAYFCICIHTRSRIYTHIQLECIQEISETNINIAVPWVIKVDCITFCFSAFAIFQRKKDDRSSVGNGR